MGKLKGHLVDFGSVAHPDWEDFDYSGASADAAYGSGEEDVSGERYYNRRLSIAKSNRERAAKKKRIKELVEEVKQAKTHEEKMRLLKKYHDSHCRRTALDFSELEKGEVSDYEVSSAIWKTKDPYYGLLGRKESVQVQNRERKFKRIQLLKTNQRLNSLLDSFKKAGSTEKKEIWKLVRNQKGIFEKQMTDFNKYEGERNLLASRLKDAMRKRDSEKSSLPTTKFLKQRDRSLSEKVKEQLKKEKMKELSSKTK